MPVAAAERRPEVSQARSGEARRGRVRPLAELAVIGLFALALAAFLRFAQPVLLPIVAALVIGTALAGLIRPMTRYGVPQWLAAALLVVAALAVLATVIVVVSGPVIEWIKRAPELGAKIRDQLRLFDAPLAALDELRNALAAPGQTTSPIRMQLGTDLLTPLLAAVTPAVTQLLLFFGTLFFFLIGRRDLRNHVAVLPAERRGRLRVLQALNDIENRLVRYLGVVTAISIGVGLVTTAMLWLIGFPNPATWGMLAFILNYVPYLGPATTIAVLFAVGLVSFPTIAQALIAPAIYLAIETIEGQIVTPAVLGREFTVNPLAVFVAIGIWTWLWGPLGALLAMPILIAIMAAAEHLPGRARLPG
jgi:predicted PurR-regulated permease PerM